MHFMKMKFSLSKSIIALGVVATLASASAYARREKSYDIVYYSDASHSEEVGRKSYACDYGSSMEGMVTAFTEYEVTVEDCNGGFPIYPVPF